MGAPSKQEIKMKRWTMLTTRIGIQFVETYSRRTAPPIWKRVERLAQSIFQKIPQVVLHDARWLLAEDHELVDL